MDEVDNYCKIGFISECGCGPKLDQQRWCKFFIKSLRSERCMYRVMEGCCDNVNAQVDAKNNSLQD